MFRSIFFLIGFSVIFFPDFSFSQENTDSTRTNWNVTYDSKLDVALGGSIEFTTPQKYGATLNLTLGENTQETVIQDQAPPRTQRNIKGINLESGLYRAGYRFGLYFINVGSSLIGTAGTRIGVIYLKNNSFSNVLKSTELIGVEAELYAFYKIKMGVLKDLNQNKYIPSLGFGFGIGPNLY